MCMFNPPHPGEVLRDYLGDISVAQCARSLKITRFRLSRLLNGHIPVTADMALSLSTLLETRAELWMDMYSGRRDRNQDPLSVHGNPRRGR